MKLSILFFALVSPIAFGCEVEANAQSLLITKVVQKDHEGVDLAVVYPDEYQGAKVSSVTLVVFDGDEWLMTTSLPVTKYGFDFEGVDLKDQSWSHLSVSNSVLEKLNVMVSYRWPPGDDGSIIVCGPELKANVADLVKVSD